MAGAGSAALGVRRSRDRERGHGDCGASLPDRLSRPSGSTRAGRRAFAIPCRPERIRSGAVPARRTDVALAWVAGRRRRHTHPRRRSTVCSTTASACTCSPPERPDGTERAAVTAVPPRRVLQLVRGLELHRLRAGICIRAALVAASRLRLPALPARVLRGSRARAAHAGAAGARVQRPGDLGSAPLALGEIAAWRDPGAARAAQSGARIAGRRRLRRAA